MPQNRRGCHGTRHFIFPDAWRASFRCEGTPLSFLRRVVGPRFKEARENKELMMNKPFTASKKTKIPCSMRGETLDRDIYFNTNKLGDFENLYVFYVDIMGMKTIMYRSFSKSTIFMGKLHCALVEASTRVPNVVVYPVMDGAYVSAKKYGDICAFITDLYMRLGRVFVETKNIDECFLIRGSLAYGPIITGTAITCDVNRTLNDAGEGTYKKHLLFGFPVVLAAKGEEQCPPFGVYFDITVRTAKDNNAAGIWYKWCSDTSLAAAMRDHMKKYYQYARSHNVELMYDVKRLEDHNQKAMQLWGYAKEAE